MNISPSGSRFANATTTEGAPQVLIPAQGPGIGIQINEIATSFRFPFTGFVTLSSPSMSVNLATAAGTMARFTSAIKFPPNEPVTMSVDSVAAGGTADAICSYTRW